MSKEDTDWVTIRHFDDQIAAEMTLNFLRDHDITVIVLGNSVATTMLNRFNTVLDIRLAVPRAELDLAEEALRAFEPEGDLQEQPFRGPAPRRNPHVLLEKPEDVEEGKPKRPRYRRAAVFLAIVLPFGLGHFYARHHVAGAVYAAGIVGSTLVALLGGRNPEVYGFVALLIVFADAIASTYAVKRYNEGRVPPASWQFANALLIVLAATVSGLLWKTVISPS